MLLRGGRQKQPDTEGNGKDAYAESPGQDAVFVGGPPVPHGVGEACELVICDGVGAKKVGEGKLA